MLLLLRRLRRRRSLEGRSSYRSRTVYRSGLVRLGHRGRCRAAWRDGLCWLLDNRRSGSPDWLLHWLLNWLLYWAGNGGG